MLDMYYDYIFISIKHQKFVDRYVECSRYVEEGIKGNCFIDIRRFDMTDKRRRSVYSFRQLLLCQTSELSVIRDFKSKLHIFGLVYQFHVITPFLTYIITQKK